ncbi:MAG: hypothetical protein AB1938_26425 [Myxococcota bacterium]
MNEQKTSTPWQGPERRGGGAPGPLFGELSMESLWRPTDKPAGASEGWLRANGYAPDRRAK